MLSRRNVRVKVMQVLYSSTANETPVTYSVALNQYQRSVDDTYRLYLFYLYQMTRIIEYTVRDTQRRKTRLVKTEEDEKMDARWYENAVSQSLLKNAGLDKGLSTHKLRSAQNPDLIKKFYKEFIDSEPFKTYFEAEQDNEDAQRKVLLDLSKYLMGSETFAEYVDDYFTNWEDDKSLVIGSIKRTIKGLPAKTDFCSTYLPDEATVKDYGNELLYKVLHFDGDLQGMIMAKLQNWDMERVTTIDMILLKMAIIEFLHFPTIPTHVTIDEYIEVAKIYSTEKSKEFINGVLDQVLKELERENRIEKKGWNTAE